MTTETFAQRLARLREAAGLTRYAAAKAAGISAIGYTRYETKGVVPSLPAAERLAAAGYDLRQIGNSECARLDGGMSCLSLRFTPRA